MTDAQVVALCVFGGTAVTVTGQVITAWMNNRLLATQRIQSQTEHLQTKTAVTKMNTTIDTIEKHTNDMLTRLKSERDEAKTQADQATGHAAGMKEEQDRAI